MEQFPVPTRDQVSANSQAQFDHLQKGLGFVPHLTEVPIDFPVAEPLALATTYQSAHGGPGRASRSR